MKRISSEEGLAILSRWQTERALLQLEWRSSQEGSTEGRGPWMVTLCMKEGRVLLAGAQPPWEDFEIEVEKVDSFMSDVGTDKWACVLELTDPEGNVLVLSELQVT